MRAVLDVNVVVAGLISPQGAPGRLLAAWRRGDLDLVISPRLVAELERALAYDRVARYVSPEQARRFLLLLASRSESLADPDGPPPVRSADPEDDYLIALAAAARAHLVSGDRDLLELAPRIPVLSPREALAHLD